MLEKNYLCACGDGLIRDQWGSAARSFASTKDYKEVVSKVTPVDGNPNTMRKIRAEATSILTILTVLAHIEKYTNADGKMVTLFINCKGLINKINNKYLHSPSLVISDHIDIIWQIKEILSTLTTTVHFEHTQPPKLPEMDRATPQEKLFHRMHTLAKGYFRTSTFNLPNHHPPLFPGQKNCITYNNKVVEANLERFLQASERKLITEEYFFKSMGIPPQVLPQIDQYALGRVLHRNKHRNAIYSKIINKQLNTMTVNKMWNLGTDTCPICHQHKEDWTHVLQCKAPGPKAKRELFLAEFEQKLQYHNTYPPLADLFYDFFESGTFDPPEEPIIVNPNYLLSFHIAYSQQSQIGWSNFARGFMSKAWKSIQFDYYRQNQCKDIFAVDKWARMVLQAILEHNRTMWTTRCDIMSERKSATYEMRQHADISQLFSYLKENPNELPSHAHHYLDEHISFFERAPFDNVLMWKRGVEISATSVNSHRDTAIKRYFQKRKPSTQKKSTRTREKKIHTNKNKTQQTKNQNTIISTSSFLTDGKY